jgi:hypothetical protein
MHIFMNLKGLGWGLGLGGDEWVMDFSRVEWGWVKIGN